MTDEKTGHPAKSTPHNSSISTVNSISSPQKGRISADLVALLALAAVAGWLLMTGGAQ
ncbi:MAG: hypothetical protein RBS27_04300 [Giesbergeria sp.]|jgi:hypothetical protein|nr:hypothetical protein [Giesbergeria sp.]MDY0105876.1 hypothetical protein [Giesbergeria sp.]